MIRTYLEPALRERFPEKPFVFHEAPNPFATFEAPCAEIGRLELCDDGDEVTVYLTELSHGHFACYDDDNPTTEEREQRIAASVVDFLAALFADRVVAYRAIGGLAGGWSVLEEGKSLPLPSKVRSQYVWSGPITNEKRG